MKKVLIVLLLMALAGPALAGMNDLIINSTVISNGCVTNAYWVRGNIMAVNVRGPSDTTCTVAIADSMNQTIFSKAKIDAYSNNTYRVRAGLHTYAGADLSNLTGATTSTYEYVYAPFAVASIVTTKVTGVNALMTTNTYVIRLVIEE